jgi:hypothetical protein
MSSVLALPYLYDRVLALLAVESPTVRCVFGWREAAKQINAGYISANRVCFVPGDGGGGLGVDRPPRWPGRNPSPLATLAESFSVRCWAIDRAAPNDELAQYTAARLLYDGVRRALALCDPGGLTVGAQRWVRGNPERLYGAEIEMVCTVDAMVPDAPYAEVLDPVGDVGITMVFGGSEIDPNPVHISTE